MVKSISKLLDNNNLIHHIIFLIEDSSYLKKINPIRVDYKNKQTLVLQVTFFKAKNNKKMLYGQYEQRKVFSSTFLTKLYLNGWSNQNETNE